MVPIWYINSTSIYNEMRGQCSLKDINYILNLEMGREA